MSATWSGGPVTARARCVLAPNPGPMTLEGTNTWVLVEPGASRAVVVDPGPHEPRHLAAVERAAHEAGARIALVLLTHGHPDHSEGAAALARSVGAPVRALDPAHCLGGAGLLGGDVVAVDGLELRVVATPGHTGDSLSFVLPAEAALLTGDTVLGRGTTVVAFPDGRLGDYLASLRRLLELAESGAVRQVLPGHGPVLADAGPVLTAYLEHRAQRLAEVEGALRAGDRTPAQVVQRVYADVDPALWPAAERSVRAALEHLEGPGAGR